MPERVTNSRRSLYDLVQEHGRTRPDNIALVESRTQGDDLLVTFAELAGRAQTYAANFQSMRIESEIIPMYLSKSAENVAAMLGALGADKAFSCLNKKLRPPQIESILEICGAKHGLIDGAGFMSWRDKFQSGWDANTEWLLLPDDRMGKLVDTILGRMPSQVPIRHWTPDTSVDLVSASTSTAPRDERPGTCLFTSGSTGTPKGVLVSRHDLAERARAEVEWFELSEDDVLLNILPFSFDVGLNQLSSALSVGCTLVLLESWLPVDICKAVATYNVTGISSVPPIWQDMLNAGVVFDTSGDHASLRYITVSGGDLPLPLLDRLDELAPGVGVFKTYGQTETFRSTSLHPREFKQRKESVGRSFVGTNVYIVRDDGTVAENGEIGEVVHTGLGVMSGYLGGSDPEQKLRPNPFYDAGLESDHPRTAHENAVAEVAAAGVTAVESVRETARTSAGRDESASAIFTGDYGYLDNDGYLYLKGRRDSMLKIASNRVYPSEVVSQLLLVDGVRDAYVTGIAVGDAPKQLVGFVVFDEESQDGPDSLPESTARETALQRALMQRLPSYMVPQSIITLSSLPRTASGKYDGVALRIIGLEHLNR